MVTILIRVTRTVLCTEYFKIVVLIVHRLDNILHIVNRSFLVVSNPKLFSNLFISILQILAVIICAMPHRHAKLFHMKSRITVKNQPFEWSHGCIRSKKIIPEASGASWILIFFRPPFKLNRSFSVSACGVSNTRVRSQYIPVVQIFYRVGGKPSNLFLIYIFEFHKSISCNAAKFLKGRQLGFEANWNSFPLKSLWKL